MKASLSEAKNKVMPEITGTNNSETLTGSSDNALIKLGDGIDIVYGNEGGDEINSYVDDAGARL